MRAQRHRRGPGRPKILGLAPRYAPNGFGGCSPAVSRPCSALLALARPSADHSPCVPPLLGATRSDRGAAATPRPRALPLPLPQPRRRPRSISRSLRAGGRAGCSGRGQRNRHMPRLASPPPYGKQGRAGRSGGRPMCSATRRDAGTCGGIKAPACALAPRLHSMAGDIS